MRPEFVTGYLNFEKNKAVIGMKSIAHLLVLVAGSEAHESSKIDNMYSYLIMASNFLR